MRVPASQGRRMVISGCGCLPFWKLRSQVDLVGVFVVVDQTCYNWSADCIIRLTALRRLVSLTVERRDYMRVYRFLYCYYFHAETHIRTHTRTLDGWVSVRGGKFVGTIDANGWSSYNRRKNYRSSEKLNGKTQKPEENIHDVDGSDDLEKPMKNSTRSEDDKGNGRVPRAPPVDVLSNAETEYRLWHHQCQRE